MKKYTSVEEIKKDFGFESSDISELKKELKELIKEIHPDTNNGKFRSKFDELNYLNLVAALEYLNQEFSIIATSQLTSLASILKESLPSAKEDLHAKILGEKIEKSIKTFRSSSLTPKISSAVFASILTFIWLFPSTVKDHPILSKYLIPGNIVYTIVWIYSTLMTGAYWLIAKRREVRVKNATNRLNLESVQNKLFDSFIGGKSYSAKKSDASSLTFDKDELIERLTDTNIFTLGYDPISHLRRTSMPNPFNLIVLGKMNIPLDLAQVLADVIVERAAKKGLIQIKNDKRLTDSYLYLLE